MALKYIDQADLDGKKVLARFDFNVPLDKKDSSVITDTSRIDLALPTIKLILESGAKQLTLMSHLGRPNGKFDSNFSMEPVAKYLAEKLGADVILAEGAVDAGVKDLLTLNTTKIVLLENLRFHPEEEQDDEEFAGKLAQYGEVYVNDAFGAAHRAHGSTAGIAKHADICAAGLLMDKELTFLEGAINGNDTKRPMVAVIGGAKVSSKIAVIESLLEKTDKVLIGGGMMWTFIKAMGYETSDSLVEEDYVDVAKSALTKAKKLGKEIMLPIDAVVASSFSNDATYSSMGVDELQSSSGMGLDIGQKTIDMFSDEILNAGTVIWNGPMGVFEFDAFSKGTFSVANALADMTDKGGISIVGGGDSVAAIQASGLASRISHISTGGGASLELLEGKILPGVACLDDA